MLLWGCRDRLRQQQVAGCYCGVAEAWQEVSKDQFVIVGLQSGAMTPFIPARMQSSLSLQDCWCGTACAAHTQGTCPLSPHRYRAQEVRETLSPPQGSGSISPDGITWDLQRVLQGPHAMPGPGCQGKRKFPRGLHQVVCYCSFNVLTPENFHCDKIAKQTHFRSKAGRTTEGCRRRHMQPALKAVRRNEAFLQLRDKSPGGQTSPYAFLIK